MPECDNCGSHVSQRFKQVCGVNGVVNGCPNCMSYRDRHDHQI